MAEVKTELGEFRKGSGASPCPLAECPWCKTRLGPSSLTLDDLRKPTAVVVGCESDQCPFCPANHPDGVPVVFVDEQIYRELPAFVVGTVDKFAMLPWRAEAGMLFGQVAAFKGRSMIEHGDAIPRGAVRLPQGLLPPELIVQDELHLISGPLGTLVGLYETAIEQLATRTDRTTTPGKVTRPKILASTATVRRAPVVALRPGEEAGMKRRWAKAGEESPIGAVRRSQLITTFGAGAMIDLVDRSALVGGLDYWHYETMPKTPINEPRLAAKLVGQMRKLGVALNPQATLFAPPACDDDQPNPRAGLQVVEFPRWMVCQGCSAMVQASTSLTVKDGRYQHPCASGKPSVLVPVRFVVVCPSGHLDEFPWVDFVHFGKDTDCRSHALTLREDAGAELYDVRLTCQACGSFKSMGEAQQLDVWYRCKGARPWLGRGPDVSEPCDVKPSMKVRTSSSTYFAQIQSALSIPNTSARLERLVRRHLPSLIEATHETLRDTIKFNPPVRSDLGALDLDAVWAVLDAVRRNETPPPPPLRPAEYAYVQDVPFEKPGDAPDAEEDEAHFFARRLAPKEPLPAGIERVVLIHELREVRAQVGFTRLAPLEANLDGDAMVDQVRTAVLGHLTDWLPAIEDHGEGLWIQLDTRALAAWESRPEVAKRAGVLRSGWDRELGDVPDMLFFGPRYYMLHALSHLLIQAISLECGYGASSLRERIYCSMPGAASSMAAILLTTTTPGSEGTLGGLVAQGRRIADHLVRALELGRLCSNDPVCASHSPERDQAERHLEGAACHGCLYLAEVSCERMNRMLDRALVVPVIDQPPELAFFGPEV